ncbi:MAG: flagellar hook-length control protein FliK [Defluviitaleaceae bacterium]|nr:flagellar hook-length control protein FliK [Defluviitaleaceae bacterium]
MKIDAMMIQPPASQKASIPQSAENRDFAEALESEVSEERERPQERIREEQTTTTENYEACYAPVYQELVIIPDDIIYYEERCLTEVLATALDADYSVVKEALIKEEFTYKNLLEEPAAVSELVKIVYQKENKAELLQIEDIEKKFENVNEVLKNPEIEKLPLHNEEVLKEETSVSKEVTEETIIQTSLFEEQGFAKLETLEIDKPAAKTTASEISQTDILDQIQNQIKTVIKSNTVTEMTMVLAPEQLGELTLKLTTRDGLVSAAFVVESEKIKEIIEKNLQELAEALELQGVEVSDLDVFVKQENNEQMEAFLREQQKSQARVSNIVNMILEEGSEEDIILENDSIIDEIA